MQAAEMLDLLTHWHSAQLIRSIDLAIAKFLSRRDPTAAGVVLLAGALASHHYGQGHSCIDPSAFLEDPDTFMSLQDGGATPLDVLIPSPRALAATIDLDQWLAALIASPLVGKGDPSAPLMFDQARLYLTRNWAQEQRIAREILARIVPATRAPSDLRKTLDQLFPEPPSGPDGGPHWQKIAAALASEGRLLILTGGPGTGKTYTVARILALLQRDHPQRILLAAPTGKAAARLSESISAALSSLPEGFREHLPDKAITLHQLLGASPMGRRFRHNEDDPLEADVVVIDEASMIDLELMATLLSALPPSARLILVGDKDQLTSVEAGSVLGDLCWNLDERGYTLETATAIARLSGEKVTVVAPETTDALAQRTVMLRDSKRFERYSGIGQLAAALNRGDRERVGRLLETPGDAPDLKTLRLGPVPTSALLERLAFDFSVNHPLPEAPALGGYRHYLATLRATRPSLAAADSDVIQWCHGALEAFSHYQILCALRKGAFGVDALNQGVETQLAAHGWIDPQGPWYEGRPVMMRRNDYELGIMNGEVGLTLAFPNPDRSGTSLKVVFRHPDGTLKTVHPGRLSEAETVYAMTIHKSQGSEFTHAALVIPEARDRAFMSRELVYTGVTRARQRLTLLTHDPLDLATCALRPLIRRGRLGARLRPLTP